MKKAFAYARFSSDNQREESIDAQLRAIHEYCEREDIELVDEFIDRAKSATTDQRPNFQRMIAAAGTTDVDYVIVHKLDRFARNRYDSAIYRRALKLNGVRLISVLERFDDSPESVILQSVLEGFAEYYSKNLAREVQKGMKETALQCKHTGGRPPLGYALNADHTYCVEPIGAAIVRTIFRMYADGHSYSEILRALDGARTGSGGHFGKNSLADILRNEKYTGTYIFNRTTSKGEDGRRNNHAQKDPSEIVRIPGGMPRIIDDETWNAVQTRLHDARRNAAGTAKRVYLLSGLLICGRCGSAMHGATSYCGRNKAEYSYYGCGMRSRSGRCDLPRFSARLLDENVLLAVEKMLSISDEELREIYDRIVERLPLEKPDTSEDRKLLDALQRRLNNLISVASQVPTESIGAEIRAVEQQIQAVTFRIAATPTFSTIPSFETIYAFVRQKLDIRKKEPIEQRALLNRLIEKIVVRAPEDFDVYFKIPGDLNTNGGGGACPPVLKKHLNTNGGGDPQHTVFIILTRKARQYSFDVAFAPF